MRVAVAPGPGNDEILRTLAPVLSFSRIASLRRRPYQYTTSFRLEELRIGLEDGTELEMILKDLSWDRLLDEARESKPAFLYDPRREVGVYRHLLIPGGVGAHCYVAVDEDSGSRPWLLLEKAPGVELWQVGDLRAWQTVARWLAGFHSRFAGEPSALRTRNPYLLSCDSAWFRGWAHRAQMALDRSEDPRVPQLRASLDRYDDVVEALDALPRTFIHGEFYPSNVLVHDAPDHCRVCPVDWEMAAIGPAPLDLAALSGGWGEQERGALVAAYQAATAELGGPDVSLDDLLLETSRCRLHLALQWLGWSVSWHPPAEHAHDWIGEALGLARELLT